MRVVIKALVFLSVAMFPCAGIAQQVNEEARKFFEDHDADYFKRKVRVSDSDLDVVAQIDTLNGMADTYKGPGAATGDLFLRAFVDKKTGEAIYQVYGSLQYYGDWRFYETVNYTAFGTPEIKELHQVNRSVGSCRIKCYLTEDFAFDVDESYLRRMAEGYDRSAPKSWRMRFNARNGLNWEAFISGSEIVGELMAVDEYRKAHGTTE